MNKRYTKEETEELVRIRAIHKNLQKAPVTIDSLIKLLKPLIKVRKTSHIEIRIDPNNMVSMAIDHRDVTEFNISLIRNIYQCLENNNRLNLKWIEYRGCPDIFSRSEGDDGDYLLDVIHFCNTEVRLKTME